MGEIGDAHQAEGQRKTRRQQEQQSAERNAVQSLDDPELHRTAARVTPARKSGRVKQVHAADIVSNHLSFEVARRREVARKDRLFQELILVVRPELAGVWI